MKNIDEVMSKLSKRTRDRVQKANEVEIKRLELVSQGLTNALGGGIGLGRFTLIWGSKSAGKTALMLQSIGEWQRQGLICAMVDVEDTFDPDWASSLGVETEKLLVSKIKSSGEMVEVCSDFILNGVDVILIDSITALVPMSWYEKNGDPKGLEGTRQIGGQAVDLANAIKLLNGINHETAIIMISQIRNKITSYGAIQEPTGGQSVSFYSTASVKVTASKSDKDQKKEEILKNGRLVELPVAREVNWHVIYNKLGSPSQSGTYDFYYAGDNVGVDKVSEVVGMAVEADIVKKTGAWFMYDEMKFHGKDAAVNYFKGNPDELNELVVKLNG